MNYLKNFWWETRLVSSLITAILIANPVTAGTGGAAERYPTAQPGISLELADARARRISSLSYTLSLRIPESRNDPIAGKLRASFMLTDSGKPLVFDFAQSTKALHRVSVNGKLIPGTIVKQHIGIPAKYLRHGKNVVDFTFTAGDAPLNRNDDYVYSLFVPARSSQAMPVFDQPNLKAKWTLSLDVPAGWTAVSNGQDAQRQEAGTRTLIHFSETAPISTYLFAFAAGRFEVQELESHGRKFRMFHREKDAAKLARNQESIARLHADALDWLETYTGIPYPYPKFDFVLIPSFQFGGMEHPGAIFYKSGSLLLDETATQSQLLSRANLIAHETAHMWFGDLVTMRWFNDVWLKEVFANFMAAKIVNPAFPEINHELRFFYQHYPAAYGVDRTEGANPIRQDLANMNQAGSLYGAIIYQKAPIVMRQLERLLGEEKFREGMQSYLSSFAHGNATWPDLIHILAKQTDSDLRAWSHAWVETRGRPKITVRMDAASLSPAVMIESTDTAGLQRSWPQAIDLEVGYGDGVEHHAVSLQQRQRITLNARRGMPTYLLPTGGGLGYGDFVLESSNLLALKNTLPAMASSLARGAALVTLWESMLEGRLVVGDVTELLLTLLPAETDELNRTEMLSYLRQIYWRFNRPEQRQALAARCESILRTGLLNATSTQERANWFSTLRNIALTNETLTWLESVWRRELQVPGLTLSENDETLLALDLAVRDIPGANRLLLEQLARIKDPDRKAKFEFALPALSSQAAVRNAFFATLKQRERRQHEDWVLQAVQYLHHPLRANSSKTLVPEALALVQEIQTTGDIFFPKGWADATLSGYQALETATAVRQFIDALPDNYPPRLRWVLLASADPLFRASRLTGQ
jgi:aminopeptidase N